jgi:hypothetical protein
MKTKRKREKRKKRMKKTSEASDMHARGIFEFKGQFGQKRHERERETKGKKK